ncbi:MAG TPA: heavy metal-binding domain-containing protein [Acidimicrobiia bacterium]|jgi:uncharacterized protein YbjQ (UPF0145 family)|nr:heavy metal-binding domain-containing protein [Acidimicrobiia bacterium]
MADQDIGYFGGGSAGHQLAVPTTTAFEIPGARITKSLGTCFGLVVRSMGMGKGIAAGFRSLVGGEVKQYTQLLEDSRRHAMDRMVENAMLVGANAVIGVRFDSSEIGQTMTEIVAYGTAVVIEAGS